MPASGTTRAAVLGTAGAIALLAALVACEREERRFSETPPTATPLSAVRQTMLQPGPVTRDLYVTSEYDDNAWAIAEGQQLYNQWNCVGCHAHGGGGMGPPLLDADWIYGSSPENIVQTILQGRPNGMPAFQGKIGATEAWKLAAYVRTLSGLTPMDARPSREDNTSYTTSLMLKHREDPKQSFIPPSAERP
jgi:cytochrome c oxidase cbb3-type subunit 3